MRISENVQAVRAAIAAAAKTSGRDARDITLIGVTKTIDVPVIKELIDAGVTDIGENRVQEFLPKYEALKGYGHRFHFIGHLQRNKVKFVLGKADLIHSVDSLSLAEEINKRNMGSPINVLAEINIAGELSKRGISPEDTIEFVDKLTKFTNIRLQGLMCVAPFVEEAEKNRRHFAQMRKLLIDINERFLYYGDMQCLSMGMSGDFIVAIEEGATMVRVGTALFGERL